MLAWLKHRQARAEAARTKIAQTAVSPSGAYTLIYDGNTVIPRHSIGQDPVADAFEARLLTWLQARIGVIPASRTGTNTAYWTFDYNGSQVSLAVIGQKKNSATPPSADTEWLLRIEEAEPMPFTQILEQCFVAKDRVKRKIYDGKVRVQFKSGELLPDSGLAG